MTDRFDFYTITAASTRKRDLLALGATPDRISTTREYVVIGRKTYPRTRYLANVAFVDLAAHRTAADASDEADRKRDALRATAPDGVTIHVRYHAAG